jgi:predicted RNA-binding protein with RPS1 domain
LKLSIKDIDYKKDGQRLKRMAETKSGFKPLKDNLDMWINEKIKEITDKM